MNSRHPVGVDILEALACAETLGRLKGSDQDPVRAEEIRNGGSFGQKFGVGEDLELAVGLGVGFEDGAHRLGGAARHGRLFDDNLGRGGDSSDAARGELNVTAKNTRRKEEKWCDNISVISLQERPKHV
jgi:hypothetical protein